MVQEIEIESGIRTSGIDGALSSDEKEFVDMHEEINEKLSGLKVNISSLSTEKDMLQREEVASLRDFRDKLKLEEFEKTSSKNILFRVGSNVKLTAQDVGAAFYIYFIHTFNVESAFVAINAACVTIFYLEYVTDDHYLASKLDFSILSFAVVFPLTFLMTQAYTRREKALLWLSDFRALMLHVTLATMVWDFTNSETKTFTGREKLPGDFLETIRDTNIKLLTLVYRFLALPTVTRARHHLFPHYRQQTEKVQMYQNNLEQRIADQFNVMYENIEIMKSSGLPANEASRVNQYHWFLQQRFEQLRNIKTYRTPQATRSFGRVYLYVLPWAFGPYFSWLGGRGGDGVTQTNYAFALVVAVFTFLVLLGLINTQRLLEDPFVEKGFDSVHVRCECASAIQTVHIHYERAQRRKKQA
eukprot:CAMPEP_0203757542 /NCGR_PEP_ID=MMETSP0098-20131031/10557_1 /ASSEMBLY_ACC=CAM_ASM_000208 /TAXON_ID=96639 /ORGANISM=" , Strain NY0313808BC1" /LENGTH=414 /DNA_ID=CAMNT_0050649761 /DNA_START=257 /DNA_END=1501 /DNA_ORIENTATION=-